MPDLDDLQAFSPAYQGNLKQKRDLLNFHKEEHDLDRLKEEQELRRSYLDKTYGLVKYTLLFDALMLSVIAINNKYLLPQPLLSDAVIMTTLGATTANCIAVFMIAMRYLFAPLNQSKNPLEKKGSTSPH